MAKTKALVRNGTPAAQRRRIFAAAYLADPNATKAAIKAGYSAKTANQLGSRLLRHPEVRAIVEAKMTESLKKLEVSRETIIAELAQIAFANVLDYGTVKDGRFELDLSRTSREQFAAVHEIVTRSTTTGEGKKAVTEHHAKLKLAGKREALVDLGRMHGLFKDDGAPGAPAQFIIQNLYVGGERERAPIEGAADLYADPAQP